jgi:hypothetical protein
VHSREFLRMAEQRPADPAPRELPEDIHAEERCVDVVLQREADPGHGNHASVHANEEDPQLGVPAVPPVLEPGSGRRRAVRLSQVQAAPKCKEPPCNSRAVLLHAGPDPAAVLQTRED